METYGRSHRTLVLHGRNDLLQQRDVKPASQPNNPASIERSWISVRGLSAVFVVALIATLMFNGV